MSAVDLNDVKAGKYQLVTRSWEKILSKPGEPLDFTRYKRGDVVDLNVEDAKRLVAAGAVVKPGELEKTAAEQALAIAQQAQRNYEAILAGLPEDVRAEVAPGTVVANPGDAPESDKVKDILAWVGEDVTRAATALEKEQTDKGEEARPSLVEALQKVVTPPAPDA